MYSLPDQGIYCLTALLYINDGSFFSKLLVVFNDCVLIYLYLRI
jgi:hypothetical protein